MTSSLGWPLKRHVGVAVTIAGLFGSSIAHADAKSVGKLIEGIVAWKKMNEATQAAKEAEKQQDLEPLEDYLGVSHLDEEMHAIQKIDQQIDTSVSEFAQQRAGYKSDLAEGDLCSRYLPSSVTDFSRKLALFMEGLKASQKLWLDAFDQIDLAAEAAEAYHQALEPAVDALCPLASAATRTTAGCANLIDAQEDIGRYSSALGNAAEKMDSHLSELSASIRDAEERVIKLNEAKDLSDDISRIVQEGKTGGFLVLSKKDESVGGVVIDYGLNAKDAAIKRIDERRNFDGECQWISSAAGGWSCEPLTCGEAFWKDAENARDDEEILRFLTRQDERLRDLAMANERWGAAANALRDKLDDDILKKKVEELREGRQRAASAIEDLRTARKKLQEERERQAARGKFLRVLDTLSFAVSLSGEFSESNESFDAEQGRLDAESKLHSVELEYSRINIEIRQYEIKLYKIFDDTGNLELTPEHTIPLPLD